MNQVTEFMEKFVLKSEINELIDTKRVVKINREYFLVPESFMKNNHDKTNHDKGDYDKDNYDKNNYDKTHTSSHLASSGIPLGLAKEQFVPSLALLEIISRKSKKKIVINEKAEWLFLCGRDIFGNSVISHNDQKKGDLTLVQNERDENLGYGKVLESISDSDHIVVKNLLDRGDFLRREKD